MNKSEKLMMEVIKEGILTGNMQVVAKGYEAITGETIETFVSGHLKPRYETVKNEEGEIVEMKALKPEPEPEPEEDRDPYDFTVKKDNKLRKRKPVTAPTSPNSFNPDEYANEDFATEAGYEAIDDKVAPTPRRRRESKPVKIECVECNKTKEVPQSLVRENYTCDDCLERKIKGKRG